LLSNSLKHAFSDGRPGVIRISLRRSEAGFIELVVADNGVIVFVDGPIRSAQPAGQALLLSRLF
jgi:two-component sensor histidine kinase